LLKVDTRNVNEAATGGRGLHGVTKFSDYSTDEFKKLLGGKISSSKVIVEDSQSVTADDVPETYVNWIGVLTTPVNDQGACGGCW
jgi:hypothetical protein